jgi:tetratricopeptide (TPR) repeat protein
MPSRPTVVPEHIIKRIAVLEGILVLLLLAFAFLVASFRAANTDLFLRMATGRLIANGEFTFGKDPFTFTAEGVWVNHGWLFDVVSYFIYRTGAAGGGILVVLKALLVVLLTWLILQTGSVPGQRRWVPALFALLAVLAASRRFYLQPAVLSYVLLALTLYLLVRVGPGSRRIWFLPLVCLLWVNVDEWFFLGPATIALFLIGELVQHFLNRRATGTVAGATTGDQARGNSVRVLGLVLVASIGACLVNPYHVRAFTLPAPLNPQVIQSAAAGDPLLKHLFLSPLQQDYFQRNLYLSAAGLAWFPLVLLGILSFIAAFPTGRQSGSGANGQERAGGGIGWQWWRVVVWLAFCALSAWNVLTIPFFAVVAAPITALNFLDFARRRLGPEPLLDPGMRRWAISGRSFTILIFILLCAVAVPGWLQAQPYYQRFVGWGIDVDRGLKAAAEQVVGWHKDGRIRGDEHWFNTAPDALHYFAYFCADERGRPLALGFMDQRVALYLGSLDDYETARDALRGALPPRAEDVGTGPDAWRKVMTDRKIRFLVFHTYFMEPMLLRLYDNPDEWEPRFIDGRSAVFAWHQPQKPEKETLLERFARRSTDEVNFEALAFGPKAVQAPDAPSRAAGAQSWWEEIVYQDSPPPVAASTARQHILRFKALSRRYGAASFIEWQGMQGASLVGMASGLGGPFVNGTLLPLRLSYTFSRQHALSQEKPTGMDQRSEMLTQMHIQTQDLGPVSSLYLAIRSARQAIRENPEDANSYLLLAEAYQRLSQQTRERMAIAGRRLQLVELIRRSQRAAALRSVLALNPRPETGRVANMMLAQLFGEPDDFDQYNRPQYHYFESQLGCYREALRLARMAEPPSGPAEESWRASLDMLDQQLQQGEQELKRRLNSYEVASVGKPLIQKVFNALEKGLSEKAVSLLMSASAEDLKKDRNSADLATMSLTLLLSLGRLPEARLGLLPEGKDEKPDKRALGTNAMGLPAYQSLLVVLGAASGDYEAADKALDETIPDIEAQSRHSVLRTLAQMDVINPPGPGDNPQSLGVFAGLVVGDVLLRNAPQAAGLPWQILPHVPARLHRPTDRIKEIPLWHVRELPPPNLLLAASVVGSRAAGLLPSVINVGCTSALLPTNEGGNEPLKVVRVLDITPFQANQFLLQWRRSQADLWTIRAWLALEQGRIDRTKDYVEKAMALVEVERLGPGRQAVVEFPSLRLALYCRYLIQPGRQ